MPSPSRQPLVCDRRDHPDKLHWHYGVAQHWCSDYGSPLLWQNDQTPGPAYVKATRTEETDHA